MKKNLYSIISGMIPEIARIKDNQYTDTYFGSGFTAQSVFVGFDFMSDSDRKAFDDFISTINRKKSICYRIVKQTYFVAGITILYMSDIPMIEWIEEEKKKAHDIFWKNDHEMRKKGFSDSARNTILK